MSSTIIKQAKKSEKRIKVLFIAHSSGWGGALVSLRYLLDALDSSVFEPVVACIHNNAEVIEYLSDAGGDSPIEVFYWPNVTIVSHTTGGWNSIFHLTGWINAVQELSRFYLSMDSTNALIKIVKPQIVHLNSLVLIPSAKGVKQSDTKLVWQIRESVHNGHFGLRKRLIGACVKNYADQAIFISKDDRTRLVGDECGIVIPNFVDLLRFNRSINGQLIRNEFELDPADKVVLFFGGVSRLKGAPILLEALNSVKKQIPELKAIFASAVTPFSKSFYFRLARKILPVLGKSTDRQEFFNIYTRNKMQGYVILLPFRKDPERLIAASDLVVFPSTKPHFARPIIEAGAMAKPVVASKIGGVEELVENGKTGLLVSPNEPKELAGAILKILNDRNFADELGEGGYEQAIENFDASKNSQRVVEVYNQLM